jgi:hypothetical protein
VRLVYAPAEGIGNFGGETDNWRWPRHTGDWSFYRAYVGPDGKPAPYAKENVPYRPKHWLPVQPAGVREGDLVFVTGYPGRTQRHQTWGEVKQTTEWTFPASSRGRKSRSESSRRSARPTPSWRSRRPAACAGSTTPSPTGRARSKGW